MCPIRQFPAILSHFLKKSLMENFIFCAVDAIVDVDPVSRALTYSFINAPFLYPLKTSEKLRVFWCFQGVEKGYIRNEWVKKI